MVSDLILMMVDRYIKLTKYIPAQKIWTTEDLVDVVVDEVFTKFERSMFVVSDRGSLFTSKFWSAFCYHLWTRLRYSTAYHPQTDGQTKRQNQTLEAYLRCYVNYQQDDWAKCLNIAEFAYNNSLHSMTKKSPFDMTFDSKRSLENVVQADCEKDIPTAKERAVSLINPKKKS